MFLKAINLLDILVKSMLQEYPMAASMKGIGMEDQTVFVSPWATSYDDEEFFVQTVSTLGEVCTQMFGSEPNLNSLIISIIEIN